MKHRVPLNDDRLSVPAFIRPDITAHIIQYGRSIIAATHVEGVTDEQCPSFMYTIGNHSKKLPELLFVTSASPEIARLLNLVSDALQGMNLFPDGLLVKTTSTAKFPVKLLRCGGRAKEYTVQATSYWGTTDYLVMQVLLPDGNGYYAGDPRCQKPYASIPVIKDDG